MHACHSRAVAKADINGSGATLTGLQMHTPQAPCNAPKAESFCAASQRSCSNKTGCTHLTMSASSCRCFSISLRAASTAASPASVRSVWLVITASGAVGATSMDRMPTHLPAAAAAAAQHNATSMQHSRHVRHHSLHSLPTQALLPDCHDAYHGDNTVAFEARSSCRVCNASRNNSIRSP